jgi:hypothetical protein
MSGRDNAKRAGVRTHWAEAVEVGFLQEEIFPWAIKRGLGLPRSFPGLN